MLMAVVGIVTESKRRDEIIMHNNSTQFNASVYAD